jgi:hypothetical protein
VDLIDGLVLLTFGCSGRHHGHVSGKRRGKRASSASIGNRSDTAPFGVSDASRPVAMTSLNTRRAVRFLADLLADPAVSLTN